MRKLSFIVLFILSFSSYAQEEIIGFWLTQDGNSIIEIYKSSNDTYFGKIVWLKEPNDKNGNQHTDKMNPDKSLRGRPIMGMNVLEHLSYNKNTWSGTIYAAKKGRKMNASLSMEGQDVVQVEVSFMGMSQIQTWTRTESPK